MAKKEKLSIKELMKGTDLDVLKKRIVPISKLRNKMSAVVYGRSGTGKTTVAASLLDLDPISDHQDKILLLDCREEGTDSVWDRKGIDMLPIQAYSDLQGIYYFLKKSDHKYKGIVIDTITSLQGITLAQARKLHGKAVNDQASWKVFGTVASLLNPLLMDFRDLPIHLVILAQDRYDNSDDENDEGDLMPEVGPACMPSVAKTINAMVKVIGQTFIKELDIKTKTGIKSKSQFRMRLGPHPYYLTKIRVPKKYKVPASIPDPSFKKIEAIMRGEYGK